jgi:hypothetical protein
MSLPFRRRGRPRGTPRLAAVKDVRAAGQWLDQISTDPADGTTWPAPSGPAAVIFEGRDTEPLGRYRGQPRYTPPGVAPHLPAAPRPAAILPMPQARAVMKLDPRRPGENDPTPHGVRAAVYIETEVGVLEDDGKLYDADASDAIARKAARRLRGARRPWKPSEEHQRELARIFGGAS